MNIEIKKFLFPYYNTKKQVKDFSLKYFIQL